MIDALLVSGVSWIVLFIFLLVAAGSADGGGSQSVAQAIAGSGIIIYGLLVIVGVWLYYALMESSANAATLGKMAFGLRVTDIEGHRITFKRATGRYFGKIVSGIILGVGYLMAGWTTRKQALHDIMAETLVLRKGTVVPDTVARNAFPRTMPG